MTEKRSFQRFPARGFRGYLGKPPARVLPKKHLATISFENSGSGAYHVVIELENRGGSFVEFKISGVEDHHSVEVPGATKHVIFGDVKVGSEVVAVRVGDEEPSLEVEETVPDGGSFS